MSDRPQPWQLASLAPQGASRVRVVLGRALVAGMLPAGPIPLDTRIDDPVEVQVDDRTAALGEVVVIDGKLAVRILSLADPYDGTLLPSRTPPDPSPSGGAE